MKKNSVVKNYIYNLIYQILIMFLPIVTTPYLSRILGPEMIGIYSYTLSISAVFILFGSLGVSLYAQREIAYNQENKDRCTNIFWEIFILKLITMLISSLVFYIIFIKMSHTYSYYFTILFFEIIFSIFDISWFFQGMEDFQKTVFRNIVVKLISVILIFCFIKVKDDLIKYYLIYVFSVFLNNLSLWFYLPKYLVKTKISKLNFVRHLKSIFILFIPQIAIEVYTVLDRTMLGYLILDKSEVGFYDQSQKVIKLLLSLVTSLGVVMLSRVSSNYSSGNLKKVKEYIYKAFNLVFLLGIPMVFGIISVSKYFVPVFFGDGYSEVILLMSVLSPIIPIIGISNVIGVQYSLSINRQKIYTTSVIIGAILNFFANLLLIPIYGALGACIGTVIAELSVSLYQLYYIRKDFSIFSILKLSKNYFISAFVMFVICFLPNLLFNDNLILVISKVILGGIIYFIMLFLLKDSLFNDVMNRIFKNVKK